MLTFEPTDPGKGCGLIVLAGLAGLLALAAGLVEVLA